MIAGLFWVAMGVLLGGVTGPLGCLLEWPERAAGRRDDAARVTGAATQGQPLLGDVEIAGGPQATRRALPGAPHSAGAADVSRS